MVEVKIREKIVEVSVFLLFFERVKFNVITTKFKIGQNVKLVAKYCKRLC